VTVRDPKWKDDRMTMLPRVSAQSRVSSSFARLRCTGEDLSAGFGRVWLPDAIASHSIA
jgi:hypothetical protein